MGNQSPDATSGLAAAPPASVTQSNLSLGVSLYRPFGRGETCSWGFLSEVYDKNLDFAICVLSLEMTVDHFSSHGNILTIRKWTEIFDKYP